MRFSTRLGFSALFLALFAPLPVRGGDALEDAVTAFLTASRGAEKERAFARVLDLQPAPERLEALLAAGREYAADAPRGWVVKTNLASDGRERPYHLFVPPSYDPKTKLPLLFNLHGGVSRPAVIPEEMFERYREQMWGEDARAGEFLLVQPLGDAKAAWWTDVGLDNLLGILSAVKAVYNVDENKVFSTGFSDGGSGSFFLAMNHTTPFAGFVPLNGFPPVAGVGGIPVFLPNASNKPMYVVNTTDDSLYPAAVVTPFIESMRAAGATRITYKVHPDIGHRPDYWPQEHDPVLAFLRNTVRVPQPTSLTWECSDPGRGRCHWLRIEEIAGIGMDDPSLTEDFNPVLEPRGVRLGIYVDQNFVGEGVRVDRLTEGESAASRAGVKVGDVILEINDRKVQTLDALRTALADLAPGDAFRLTLRRGEEDLEVEGNFPSPEPRPAFVREGIAGRIAGRCQGNTVAVTVRNVARFTLLVSRALFDVGEPIAVTVNGRPVFQGHVTPDPAFMLAMAAQDEDRAMLYWGRIEVDLREGAGKEKGDEGGDDDSEF